VARSSPRARGKLGGDAGQGDRGRGSPESRVDGEGGAEAAARRRSEVAAESGGRRGQRRGLAAGGGNGKGEGPPGQGEGARRVKLTVGGDRRRQQRLKMRQLSRFPGDGDGRGAVSEGGAHAMLEKEERGGGEKRGAMTGQRLF
jgi:hypothetical protein